MESKTSEEDAKAEEQPPSRNSLSVAFAEPPVRDFLARNDADDNESSSSSSSSDDDDSDDAWSGDRALVDHSDNYQQVDLEQRLAASDHSRPSIGSDRSGSISNLMKGGQQKAGAPSENFEHTRY